MRLSPLLWRLFVFFIYPAVIGTTALYLYPAVLNCSFPLATKPETQCLFDKNASSTPAVAGKIAPFRLLALGDPQLEGDTSLPTSEELSFPSIRRLRRADNKLAILRQSAADFVLEDIPAWSHYIRKKVDLVGNDYYLAHIYRTLHWWTSPTHVAVLGDLLGSQWIDEDDFSRRSWRYWNRVFRHGSKVEDSITSSFGTEVLGADELWSRRVINIAGNHDIGYAGDIDRDLLNRFEREFGPVNWDINFQLPRSNDDGSVPNAFSFGAPPSLRLVVLNNMNLDGPAKDDAAQLETYQYMNDLISKRLHPVEDRTSAVVLLTHIPLYKPDGVCVDGPYFSYRDTGVKEQNHLSQSASAGVLEGIFGKSNKFGSAAKGLGRQGIIINGHDHEGCDVYHHTSPPPSTPHESDTNTQEAIDIQKDFKWHARRWWNASSLAATKEIPGIREITLRSMMGSYGGNAGLLSGWYDEDEGQWHFEQASCPLGVQHIWWTVHILDVALVVLLAATGISYAVEQMPAKAQTTASSKLLAKHTSAVKWSPGSNSIAVSEIEVKDVPATPKSTVRKKKSAKGSLRDSRDTLQASNAGASLKVLRSTPSTSSLASSNGDAQTPSKRSRGRTRKGKRS